MLKKAAIYIRVSTNYQIDKDSLPLQRQELINYAQYALNISDYEIFEDAGYSGKNTDRPAYQEMMKGVRSGEFSHIMVYKIDRISRNLVDFATMYAELKQLGVIFISKNEQFDTSSAMGEAMLKIILVFAELERNMTSERVTAVMLSRAEKGLWNGANVPLGYKWSEEKKFPVIDDTEADTVKVIFNLYEKYYSTTQVVTYLNRNEYQTKRGGKWRTKVLCDILRNPFYKGTLRYNYRNAARGKKKSPDDWIIIDNNHDAIITIEQWERCNKILDANALKVGKFTTSQQHKHVHVFAGILRCSCGGSVWSGRDRPRANGFRPSVYRCNNLANGISKGCKMTSDIKVGNFVFNYVKNMLNLQNNNLDTIEKDLLYGSVFNEICGIEQKGLNDLLNVIQSNHKIEYMTKAEEPENTKNNITSLENEKAKFKKALDRLKKLYLYDDDTLSEKDFILEKKKITDQINELDLQIQSMNSTPTFNPEAFLSTASNLILLKQLSISKEIDYLELAANASPEVLKDFVLSIISKIIFEGKKIISVTFKNGIEHKFIYK